MSKPDTYYLIIKNNDTPISFLADDWRILNRECGKFLTFSLNGIYHTLFLRVDMIEDLYLLNSVKDERKYIIKGGKE